MTNIVFQQFIIILPELMITLLALFTQLAAILFNDKNKIISVITIILATTLILCTLQISIKDIVGFNNSFAINYIIGVIKSIVLIFTIITIIIYNSYCDISGEELKNEFITLILLSTVGIFIAISSRNFLLLFCSMELQSLVSYVLAGFNLTNIKSSEGALKYFILGALISCLALLGISFIYGFSGSLEFDIIKQSLNQSSNLNIGLVIGLVLFLSSIFFKLSNVPLHMWAPDVYEGSPVTSIIYFVTAQKIGVVAILINITTLVIGDYIQISIDLIRVIAILSMLVGVVGAIRQRSLKRLMAYSTILNIGYVLIGIVLHSEQGNFVAMLYIFIYAISTMGFFTFLMLLLGKNIENVTFDDITGIYSNHKAIAGSIVVIMCSMIGVPPLAGFFGKYYVFYQAVVHKEFLLAFIAIITTIIAAYYYLKIIKSMYFIENNLVTSSNRMDKTSTSKSLLLINCLVIGFLLFFSFFIPIYY